jgi:hypothetical protein
MDLAAGACLGEVIVAWLAVHLRKGGDTHEPP